MLRKKDKFITGALVGVVVAYLPKIFASTALSSIVNFLPEQIVKLLKTPEFMTKYLLVGDPTLWTVFITSLTIGTILALAIKR